MYKDLVKPFFDFILSLLGLIIVSPVFIVITILLAIANRGKPFFFQQRPGKLGKNFKIVKFRTMTDARDNEGKLLPDEKRLTEIGKIVRKTSLDEIPQLINVLKGDMSFVGPRPLLPQYIPLYSKDQLRRHDVRPGITGWAQVNGRNAISWTKKFELDVWYVDNISFWLDLKILFKTVQKVLVSEGINSENMATTEPFNGNN